jgi:hypothetical protein
MTSRNLYLREWQQYVGAQPYERTCDNLVPLPEATSTLSGYMTAEAQNRATLAAMATPTP